MDGSNYRAGSPLRTDVRPKGARFALTGATAGSRLADRGTERPLWGQLNTTISRLHPTPTAPIKETGLRGRRRTSTTPGPKGPPSGKVAAGRWRGHSREAKAPAHPPPTPRPTTIPGRDGTGRDGPGRDGPGLGLGWAWTADVAA
ncbi:hypothetical protein GCM10022251_49170 [Phytohabitans flavus]